MRGGGAGAGAGPPGVSGGAGGRPARGGAAMTPEVGKTYYRKGKSGHALVVRVLAVGEWVEYQVVRGPRRALALGTGRCKAANFTRWEPTPERDDYADLDGCKRFATFLVLDTR